MILRHVTSPAEWAQAQARGEVHAPSLETVGFLHLCTEAQLTGVLERFFAGAGALVILHVDDAGLSDVRWELAADVPGERFPHLYGPLPLEAVVQVEQKSPRSQSEDR